MYVTRITLLFRMSLLSSLIHLSHRYTRMHKYTSTTKLDIAWGAETDYDIKEASLNDTMDTIKHHKHIAILFRLSVCGVTLKEQGDILAQTSLSLSANNFPFSTSTFIFSWVPFCIPEHICLQSLVVSDDRCFQSWNQSFLRGNMMNSCLITFVH